MEDLLIVVEEGCLVDYYEVGGEASELVLGVWEDQDLASVSEAEDCAELLAEDAAPVFPCHASQ